MEKVMLSKEEATALESALEISGGDRASVSQWHGQNLWAEKQEPLNDLDLETVNIALYVGYEVEPGPAEKILKIYNSLPSTGFNRKIIKDILEALNIQISGINC